MAPWWNGRHAALKMRSSRVPVQVRAGPQNYEGMEKEIRKKIESCKALQGVSVMDIITSVRFRDNLAAYMTAQREVRKAIKASYDAMKAMGGAKGYRLPSHAIDRCIDLSVLEFAMEYMRVLSGSSDRSFAERQYIKQLGQQAYNLTIAQIVVAEFSELENTLIPKSNNT